MQQNTQTLIVKDNRIITSSSDEELKVGSFGVKDKRQKKGAKKRDLKLQREESKTKQHSSPNLLTMPEWNEKDPKRVSSVSTSNLSSLAASTISHAHFCGSSFIKKRCATDCSQWTLHILKTEPSTGKPPYEVKICDMVSESTIISSKQSKFFIFSR